MTKHIRLMETHRLATSPIKNSKAKRDLTKDLDDVETHDDDGLDHLSVCHIRNNILEDSLAEDNSHLGDIYQLEPKQKSKNQNFKTF